VYNIIILPVGGVGVKNLQPGTRLVDSFLYIYKYIYTIRTISLYIWYNLNALLRASLFSLAVSYHYFMYHGLVYYVYFTPWSRKPNVLSAYKTFVLIRLANIRVQTREILFLAATVEFLFYNIILLCYKFVILCRMRIMCSNFSKYIMSHVWFVRQKVYWSSIRADGICGHYMWAAYIKDILGWEARREKL